MMLRALLVLIVTAGVACSHKKTGRSATGADAPIGEFALEVVNHHWLDVRVYIVHEGERQRVGIVTAASNQRFVLPTRMLGPSGDIILLGEPVGSRETVRTERLIIKPGQLIEWTLETDLRRSSVGVY